MQQEFEQWIAKPFESDYANLAQLASIRKQFPYCSIIHTLEAVHALKADKGLYQEMVRKAAVYAFSRAQLRQLLKQSRIAGFVQPRLPEIEKEIVLPVEIIVVVEVEKIIPKNSVPEYTVEDDFSIKTAESTPDEKVQQPEQAELEPSPQIAKAQAPQYIQLDLIDKFIEREPRIKPSKDQPEAGTQKDFTAGIGEWDKQIVSETLAIVLLKQKKFEKAIDMYEKLKLKFPEKTTYFAALIENIRKLIDSKTDNS